jgi:tripartite-type tricarboxylate transporter receptor subunit TctC
MGHLVMERFRRDAGIPMTHVPYKGSGAAALDVAGGRVDLFLADQTSSMPLVRSGKLRPLAIGGTARLPELPDVATFGEQGFPNLVPSIWAGLAAPPSLPADTAQRLAAAIKSAYESPAVQDKLRASGNEPWHLPPADMHKYVNDSTRAWADFIRKNGVAWN